MKIMPGTRRIAVALLTFTAFLASTPANSTTLVRMSVAQMTRAAQLVVRVRCVSNSSSWDAGEIWTFTSFAVQETWKSTNAGNPPSTYLTVRLLGGQVGNLTSTVSGIPRFVPGEEVVLFLEPTARGDYSIVSWVQGTFRIRRDSRTSRQIAVQDTASFDTFDPAARQFYAVGLHHIAVEDLHSLVTAEISTNTNSSKGKNEASHRAVHRSRLFPGVSAGHACPALRRRLHHSRGWRLSATESFQSRPRLAA